MTETSIVNAVGEAIAASVGETRPDMGGDSFLSWMVRTGDLLPPWWSASRDRRLSQIWKESDHVSIAVYNTIAKIVGIPPRIIPTNTALPDHMLDAEIMTRRLFISSDFGKGWDYTYSKFIESFITQDNGAFMEVIGDGAPDGPIQGAPISIRHLDSSRCTRTGDPIFPVVYTDDVGGKYKIHWTRIIFMSQMPSSKKEMNGVGFCAVSRCAQIGQTLADIIRYKQERLGSRPHNQMLIGQGITAKQIMMALRQVEEDLNNRGFARYARTVAIGSESTEVDIKKIDLNHMDPFDEETSINLGMFAIASAFGMDADEIWPVGGKSAGKAEAQIRSARSRGRLPAQITNDLIAQFNFKVMPQHLRLEFDFRDDAEDMQRANIKDIRGRNRERDIGTGAINIRGARMRMLNDGDIDRYTFDQMELSDGRMPDGRTLGILFFMEDPAYKKYLQFMPDPLQVTNNISDIDPELRMSTINDAKLDQVIVTIQAQREAVLAEWGRTSSASKAEKMQHSFYALDWLEEQYRKAAGELLPEVPMQSRRQRTDIRVVPVETSPPAGEQSPAGAAGGRMGENVSAVGGE